MGNYFCILACQRSSHWLSFCCVVATKLSTRQPPIYNPTPHRRPILSFQVYLTPPPTPKLNLALFQARECVSVCKRLVFSNSLGGGEERGGKSVNYSVWKRSLSPYIGMCFYLQRCYCTMYIHLSFIHDQGIFKQFLVKDALNKQWAVFYFFFLQLLKNEQIQINLSSIFFIIQNIHIAYK